MQKERCALNLHQHQFPTWRGVTFCQKGISSDEIRFVPVNSEAKAGLKNADLRSDVMAPMPEAFFNPATVKRIVPETGGSGLPEERKDRCCPLDGHR